MSNKKSNEKKGLMISLVIFAAIGIICVLGLGTFGAYKLFSKLTAHEEPSGEIVQIELEDKDIPEAKNEEKIEEASEDVVTVGSATSSAEINGVFEDVQLPEVTASVEEEHIEIPEDDGKYQIVFMGDSILDNFRDETGIAYLVGQQLDATVINLSIAGTCASISTDNHWEDDQWDATCGAGVAKAVAGKVDPDVFFDCTAKNLIKEYKDSFDQTDLFIIEYGINDFMFGRQMCDMENLMNPTTYEGGLRQMMLALTEKFPNAKFLLCQPSYVEFYRANGEYVGNSYVLNNGPGTEYDYGQKTHIVAGDYGALFFSFEDNGITMYNAADTLLDGVHLSEEGRRIYSDNLVKFIRENIPEVNQ